MEETERRAQIVLVMENTLVWNEYISFASSKGSTAEKTKSKTSKSKKSDPSKKTSGKKDAKNNSKKNKGKKNNSFGGAVIFMLLITAIILLLDYTGDKFVKAPTAFDSMTVEELNAFMKPHMDNYIAKKSVKVTIDGKVYSLRLSDYGFEYSPDTQGKTEYVYEEGKRNSYTTTGVLKYNRTALNDFITNIIGSEDITMTEPHYVIDYDKKTLTVYPGKSGKGVDIDRIIKEIEQTLCLPTPNATASIKELPAPEIDMDAIYKSVYAKAADAYKTEDEEGNITYHDEVIGVDFNVNSAKKLLTEEKDSYVVNIDVTMPEVTVKWLRAYTFPDLLASYYTYYSESNGNRSHNLSLAAQKINGLVLEPGEQFSFNGTVGKRTAARGFKIAGVYTSEGGGESYGGGICQTSSTLYYTCILANLQIDDRRNHMYTVSYMRDHRTGKQVHGADATVNWGTTDFKFSNDKEYPIKIEIYAKDGVLYCNIYGTADGYSAAFEYEHVKTTPYKIKYKTPDGSKNQSGQNGRVVKTYRVVYKDGIEVERRFEAKNTYTPMTKIVYTNNIPDGFEYGKEYSQDYKPPKDEGTGDENTGGENTGDENTGGENTEGEGNVDVPETEGDSVVG